MASHRASGKKQICAAKCVRGKGKMNWFVSAVKKPGKKEDDQEQSRAEQSRAEQLNIRWVAKWNRLDMTGLPIIRGVTASHTITI